MTFYAEDIEHNTAFKDDDMQLVSGVYLHGELEKRNGFFDLVCQYRKDGDYVEDDETIENVEVIFADGSKHEAIAYIWKSPSKYEMTKYSPIPMVRERGRIHGLICAIDDKKANEDALEKFNARVEQI